MRYSDYRKSPAMKDLNLPLDRKQSRQFYDALKKNSGGGGITRDEFRKTLGDLMSNQNDSITKGKVMEIGRIMKKELGDKRYIMPKPKKKNIQQTNIINFPQQKFKTMSNSGPSTPRPLKPVNTAKISKIIEDLIAKPKMDKAA